MFGGFTPRLYAELRRLGRLNYKLPLSRDGTKYGSNPRSASSWLLHHTRLISLSVVVADAYNILNEANKAKLAFIRSPSGWPKLGELDGELG